MSARRKNKGNNTKISLTRLMSEMLEPILKGALKQKHFKILIGKHRFRKVINFKNPSDFSEREIYQLE